MIWLVVIVGLLLLIFVHELGHFTVALLVGIRPRAFYIGFPPAIAKFRRNGIEYAIGAIPLGGFVRIPGMHRPAGRDVEAFLGPAVREDADLAAPMQRVRDQLEAGDLDGARDSLPELRRAVEAATLTPSARRSANRALRDVDEGTSADAYWRQKTWKRVAALAAGPAANILVAFLLFFVVYLTGAPSQSPSTEVGQVEANTPAAAAGLHAGDKVIAVDGRAAQTFDQVSQLIRSSDGRPITVTVKRSGQTLTLGPRRTIRSGGRWIWGFVPAAQLISYPAGHSARLAADDCWLVVVGTVKAFGALFGGHEHGQLTSTVGIVRVSAAALKVGLNWYLQILAFVSMSLALFNLLPLLPLDGGHITFSIIEGIRRRAVPREIYERVSVLGMAFIALITVIAFSSDFSGGGPH
jgi:regulator of sigma E protease